MTTSVRRGLMVLAITIVAIIGGAAPVSAHADLISSTPPNGALLHDSPTEVLLTFSEAIDPVDPAVRIVDGDGNEINTSTAHQDNGTDTLALSVDDQLDDGTYVVAWQALSIDSHNIRGAFTFSVGETSATRTGLLDDVFDSANASPGGTAPLAIGRGGSYAGLAILLGGLFAAIVIAPGVAASRRTGRVLWVGYAIASGGTSLMVAAQANLIGTTPFDWTTVADTQSGRWWIIRLLAIVALGPLIARRRQLTTASGRTIVVAAGLGVLAIVAAGGHGVTGRWIPVGYTATIVHLAAMTIWVGGLTLIATGLPRSSLSTVANRFSPWALGSVGVLAVTGTINGYRQIGSPGGITESSYGRWLIVKVAVVGLVIGAAAVTRRILHHTPPQPNIASLALSADVHSDVGSSARSERLSRSVFVELAGIVLVVAATSGLVNSPPPGLNEPSNEVASLLQGDRIAQVELEPAVTGGTIMHVTITSPRGAFDRADEITVAAELASASIGPIEIGTIPAGPNHVIANDAQFPVAGLWTIQVTARYGEFDQVVFDIDIPVTG